MVYRQSTFRLPPIRKSMNKIVLAITLWVVTAISLLAEVWVWAIIGYSTEIGTAWTITTVVIASFAATAGIWNI